MTKVNLKNILTVVRDIINRSSETAIRKAQSAEKQAGAAQATAKTAKTAANNAQTTANNAQTTASNAERTAKNAETTANNAQTTASNAERTAKNAETTANNAHTTADAALANFPVKYTDVVDTPFSAIGLPSEVTTYLRSSVQDGTFINLYLVAGTQFTGSGFYKISSDVFDFEDIYKISYKNKYSSGNSSSLISIDNLEQRVRFSNSDHSVFAIDSEILFCGSTGEFEIIPYGTKAMSFHVAETGIYSISDYKSTSYSFVNYIELTKKESVFIQTGKPVLIPSSTEGSTKKFKITIDDSGTLTATEVTT